MEAKYIFRLDDIAPNMVWENYFLLKNIFERNQVKPIIGVIPHNEDPELLKHPKCDFDFWEEIRSVQNLGWSIALHGYNHKYITNDPGLLRRNRRSEFAGVPRDIQNEKIAKGKSIFSKNGIRIDAFMAPAHSYDETTLEVLVVNDIRTITDGYTLYPYFYKGILFVPQVTPTPRKMPFGVFTWCLHPNTMSIHAIQLVEQFIVKNRADLISFPEARSYVKNSKANMITAKFNQGFLNARTALYNVVKGSR